MDGELRLIFRKNLPQGQWTAIESGATASGIPDAEFCFTGGVQGWVEFKRSQGWTVGLRPEQVGWLLRRVRLGGRCFVVVRRMSRDADELWMMPGSEAAILKSSGLKAVKPLFMQGGGPGKWDWSLVQHILMKTQLSDVVISV